MAQASQQHAERIRPGLERLEILCWHGFDDHPLNPCGIGTYVERGRPECGFNLVGPVNQSGMCGAAPLENDAAAKKPPIRSFDRLEEPLAESTMNFVNALDSVERNAKYLPADDIRRTKVD